MLVILFFVLLFTGCMLYYLLYTFSYLMFKYNYPEPTKKTVTIVQSKVVPIDYRIDFAINEKALKHESEQMKITKDAVARDFASRRIADEILKLVKEDMHNELFQLVSFDRSIGFMYEDLIYYKISFSLVPQFANKVPWNSKLI